MKIQTPIGARVIVEDIEPLDEVTAKAMAAGLHVLVSEQNKPRATTGWVRALGTDPLLNENVRLGDVVFFNWHAGTRLTLNGKDFRILDFSEILSIQRDGDTPTES